MHKELPLSFPGCPPSSDALTPFYTILVTLPPVGGAVITPAGDLSASFIVHVALQSHEEPVSAGVLRKALLNGLRHACRMGIETMAIPPLGTGAGNLDAEVAADVMFEVLRGHMEDEEYPREVTVMVTTEYELQAFASRLAQV